MQNRESFTSSPTLSLGFRSHNSNICSHLLIKFSFHPIKEVIVIAAIRISENAIRIGGKAIRIGGKDNEASIII